MMIVREKQLSEIMCSQLLQVVKWDVQNVCTVKGFVKKGFAS